MKRMKVYIAVLLLGGGALGLTAWAQTKRAPWPPAPIAPPAVDEVASPVPLPDIAETTEPAPTRDSSIKRTMHLAPPGLPQSTSRGNDLAMPTRSRPPMATADQRMKRPTEISPPPLPLPASMSGGSSEPTVPRPLPSTAKGGSQEEIAPPTLPTLTKPNSTPPMLPPAGAGDVDVVPPSVPEQTAPPVMTPSPPAREDKPMSTPAVREEETTAPNDRSLEVPQGRREPIRADSRVIGNGDSMHNAGEVTAPTRAVIPQIEPKTVQPPGEPILDPSAASSANQLPGNEQHVPVAEQSAVKVDQEPEAIETVPPAPTAPLMRRKSRTLAPIPAEPAMQIPAEPQPQQVFGQTGPSRFRIAPDRAKDLSSAPVRTPKLPAHKTLAPPKRKGPPAFRLLQPLRRADGTLIGVDPDDRSGPMGKGALYHTDSRVPVLTVRKVAPTTVFLGQTIRYTVIVRNIGGKTAENVRVEDKLPYGTKILSVKPEPQSQGERLVWLLAKIGPGKEERLEVMAQPTAAGDFTSAATVSLVSASKAVKTRVKPSPLVLSLSAPANVQIGKEAVYKIEVTNTGGTIRRDMILRASLPDGISHPQGPRIETDIAELAPGERREFLLTGTAVEKGTHVAQVWITSGGAMQAVARATTIVGEGQLTIRAIGARIPLGDSGELKVEIVNSQAKAVRDLSITASVADGLEFTRATDQGIYRASTRTVGWLFDYLSPGEKREVSFNVEASKAGSFVYEVTAKNKENKSAVARAAVIVKAAAALSLEIKERDDPLETGAETEFDISVTNKGNAVDKNVRLAVILPGGLTPRFAKGPTQYRIEGQTITFAPLDALRPAGRVSYRIGVLARAAGDLRTQVQLSSDQMTTPVSREERTFVYRDR